MTASVVADEVNVELVIDAPLSSGSEKATPTALVLGIFILLKRRGGF
jgi:hypothetical protein